MHTARQKRLFVGPYQFIQDQFDASGARWIVPGAEPKTLEVDGCKHLPPRPYLTITYSEAFVMAVENNWETPKTREVFVYYKTPAEMPGYTGKQV